MKAHAIPMPNVASTTMVTPVSFQFRYRRMPSAITAVSNEPLSCTSPVPTRFLMPSASFMMREMRMPVLVESK